MKIRDLLAALSAYDPEAKVVVTWDMCAWDCEVYQAPSGTVVLEADDDAGMTRDMVMSGEMVV